MRNLSLLTKLFIMAFLGLGLALFGCPPDSEGDDDDAAGDDDDVVGDDDDVVGDDDDVVGDDDDVVGDDDDVVGTIYTHVQSLQGQGASNPTCPSCTYEFTINFTTDSQSGSCMWCYDLSDGAHDLGYGGGAVYYLYAAYGAWYWWYYGSMSADTVDFWYDAYYYNYGLSQSGYWNILGGGNGMEGMVTTEETG